MVANMLEFDPETFLLNMAFDKRNFETPENTKNSSMKITHLSFRHGLSHKKKWPWLFWDLPPSRIRTAHVYRQGGNEATDLDIAMLLGDFVAVDTDTSDLS